MFCPLGQTCLSPFFWYTSHCPCSLLIPSSIWAVRLLQPCVWNVCVAEITISMAKWKKQKRVKMMTQIRLFSALLPTCYGLKKELFCTSRKSVPTLTRSKKLSFKCCINTSDFIFWGFWGNCQVREALSFCNCFEAQTVLPTTSFVSALLSATLPTQIRIPVWLSAALFPSNSICLCLHLPYRLSHSATKKSFDKYTCT